MIEALREQIEKHDYVVDPALVAAAILAKRAELGRLRQLRSEVLVAAQGTNTRAGEREPFTGRYTA